MDTPTGCRWGLPEGMSCDRQGVHLSFRPITDSVFWSISCDTHTDDAEECAWYWFALRDDERVAELITTASMNWYENKKLPAPYSIPEDVVGV